MRILDWGIVVDAAIGDKGTTMFDEIVVVMNGMVYEIDRLEVLVRGDDTGPGLLAIVTGNDQYTLHEEVPRAPRE